MDLKEDDRRSLLSSLSDTHYKNMLLVADSIPRLVLVKPLIQGMFSAFAKRDQRYTCFHSWMSSAWSQGNHISKLDHCFVLFCTGLFGWQVIFIKSRWSGPTHDLDFYRRRKGCHHDCNLSGRVIVPCRCKIKWAQAAWDFWTLIPCPCSLLSHRKAPCLVGSALLHAIY